MAVPGIQLLLGTPRPRNGPHVRRDRETLRRLYCVQHWAEHSRVCFIVYLARMRLLSLSISMPSDASNSPTIRAEPHCWEPTLPHHLHVAVTVVNMLVGIPLFASLMYR